MFPLFKVATCGLKCQNVSTLQAEQWLCEPPGACTSRAEKKEAVPTEETRAAEFSPLVTRGLRVRLGRGNAHHGRPSPDGSSCTVAGRLSASQTACEANGEYSLETPF